MRDTWHPSRFAFACLLAPLRRLLSPDYAMSCYAGLAGNKSTLTSVNLAGQTMAKSSAELAVCTPCLHQHQRVVCALLTPGLAFCAPSHLLVPSLSPRRSSSLSSRIPTWSRTFVFPSFLSALSPLLILFMLRVSLPRRLNLSKCVTDDTFTEVLAAIAEVLSLSIASSVCRRGFWVPSREGFAFLHFCAFPPAAAACVCVQSKSIRKLRWEGFDAKWIKPM